MMFLNKLQQT